MIFGHDRDYALKVSQTLENKKLHTLDRIKFFILLKDYVYTYMYMHIFIFLVFFFNI